MKFDPLKAYFENEGITRVGEILDEFYKKMASDVMIGFFFYNKDLKKIAAGQTSFLWSAMGLGRYSGPTVKMAHRDLPQIRRGQFFRRLVILQKVLESFSVPEVARNSWIEFEKQFEKVVVLQ